MAQVSIYIDGGVFSDGVRGQGMSMDMDLMALARQLAGDDTLADVYYIAPVIPAKPYPTKHANLLALFERLRDAGITVLTARPKVVGSIFVDAGIETLMSVQMLTDGAAGKFDRAIVVSNRAPLAPALDAVRAMGREVEVAFFNYSVAPGNALAPDGFTTITPDQIIALTKSGPRPPVWS